jgi:amidase
VSTVSPNFGLLSGSRLAPNLQPELVERVWIWTVDESRRTLRTATRSGREIETPLQPFHGCVGVAPPHGEVRNSVVPDSFGGNIDLPILVQGTTLYLLVNVPEAKLWIGDGQFAQGDGEIAGTAIEGAMLTRLVTEVICPGDGVEWPRVETDDAIMVVGCARPLEDAARIASAGLVRWVAHLCQLELDDALQLVSQSMRFRIANLVNPVFSVAAILEKQRLPNMKPIFSNAHARLSQIGKREGHRNRRQV